MEYKNDLLVVVEGWEGIINGTPGNNRIIRLGTKTAIAYLALALRTFSEILL
jgi:hypothetical protein